MIADNLKYVTQRVAMCCEKTGRRPEDVRLVCVTKTASVEQIREAVAAGARIIGENRVQDALAKHRLIGDAVVWHLIGHLQTNKARDAVRIFSLIHTVDSIRLARAIDREAAALGKIQDVLVQVNISGEDTKFGIAPECLDGLLGEMGELSHIRVGGLMTIAPLVDDPEKVRLVFRALRKLLDASNGPRSAAFAMRELSMGMTDDFEVAVEEGSTLVRAGRAIFGGAQEAKA